MNELIQKMQQIDEIKNSISSVIASTGEEVPSFAEYPASLQQIADERSTLISDYQEFKSIIEDQLGEENEEKQLLCADIITRSYYSCKTNGQIAGLPDTYDYIVRAEYPVSAGMVCLIDTIIGQFAAIVLADGSGNTMKFYCSEFQDGSITDHPENAIFIHGDDPGVSESTIYKKNNEYYKILNEYKIEIPEGCASLRVSNICQSTYSTQPEYPLKVYNVIKKRSYEYVKPGISAAYDALSTSYKISSFIEGQDYRLRTLSSGYIDNSGIMSYPSEKCVFTVISCQAGDSLKLSGQVGQSIIVQVYGSEIPLNDFNQLTATAIIKTWGQYSLCAFDTNYLSGHYDGTTVFPLTPGSNKIVLSGYEVVMPEGAKCIGMTSFNIDQNPIAIFKNGAIESNVKDEISKIDLQSKASPLNGKNYVAFGDSWTYGHQIASTSTYSGIAAQKNGMTYKNDSWNGATMTSCENTYESFSNKIDQLSNDIIDADYITLAFGLNDKSKQVPIGVSSDTDISTYYGAWNTSIDKILSWNPDAHVGILLLGQNLNQSFYDATIDVAKTNGIPFFDMNNDPTLPPLIYNRIDNSVKQSIMSKRYAEFFDVTKSHPNSKWHEYVAGMLSEFLRRI